MVETRDGRSRSPRRESKPSVPLATKESPIQVVARKLNGEAVHVSPLPSETVWSLKQRLAASMGSTMPVNRVGVSFRGGMLKNESKLSEAGVTDGDAVDLVIIPPAFHTFLADIGLNGINERLVIRDGKTAMHIAAQRNRVEVVTALLDCNEFELADAQDPLGYTALHSAAEAGHEKVVDVLLEHPRFAMKKAKNANGLTALDLAMSRFHFGVAQKIQKYFFRQPVIKLQSALGQRVPVFPRVQRQTADAQDVQLPGLQILI